MAPSPQLVEFVNFEERVANSGAVYYQGNGRCDPEHSGYSDCSGLVVAGVRHVGGSLDCTGSFALSQMCHNAGTGISEQQARETRGALCFMGINEGKGGRPGIDPGHVATSRGDGTTVEARNRRAGILYGPFDGRGWTYYAMPAWFPLVADGTSPLPPPEVLMKFVAIKDTRSGKGYYCLKDDGSVFCYGDAKFHGGLFGVTLNAPIVDIAVRPSNKGYLLVAADGGVFAYGDAKFHGSAAKLHLAAPITGIAAMRNNNGYWLLGGDGGVFAYGAAKPLGHPH